MKALFPTPPTKSLRNAFPVKNVPEPETSTPLTFADEGSLVLIGWGLGTNLRKRQHSPEQLVEKYDLRLYENNVSIRESPQNIIVSQSYVSGREVELGWTQANEGGYFFFDGGHLGYN